MALVVGKILNHDIQDPRPFVVKHITPLVAHAADNGFPSDHTLLTMTIASIVFVYNKKLGIILGAISLCVGLARVFAQIHHLEDIIGSIIIAIGSTYVAYIVLPHILKKTGKQE